jgi:curli production assembly/transport component CsgG
MAFPRVLLAVALLPGLAACASSVATTGSLNLPSRVGLLTSTSAALAALPPAKRRTNVAVYEFPDLTGQNRPNANYADYSRAITQGAAAIVAGALKTAGSGTWFNVVERTNIDSLLRERRLIQDTYEVLKKSPKDKIKPLEFAEYIVTGGIVSFDAPIVGTNIAATYAGVGGGLGTNRNLITVNLRLVRVKDGAVLSSVDVSRPIVSATVSANASRSLTRTRVLEAEASLTVAEATQVAVREAIEAGIYEIARDGAGRGLWSAGSAGAEPGGPANGKTATSSAPKGNAEVAALDKVELRR